MRPVIAPAISPLRRETRPRRADFRAAPAIEVGRPAISDPHLLSDLERGDALTRIASAWAIFWQARLEMRRSSVSVHVSRVVEKQGRQERPSRAASSSSDIGAKKSGPSPREPGWRTPNFARSPNKQIDVDLSIFGSLILPILSASRACARKASNRRRIRRTISLFSAGQGTLIPCSAKKVPVRSRREFFRNRLESLGLSGRFFPKSAEIRENRCFFPCLQGIGPALVPTRPRGANNSREHEGSERQGRSTSCLRRAPVKPRVTPTPSASRSGRISSRNADPCGRARRAGRRRRRRDRDPC